MHSVGKTGVGKSTLLLNMILADINAGRGTVVIDPAGDLITDILDRLPADVADRIVLIDPDQENPRAASTPSTATTRTWPSTTSSAIFAKIFPRHWGPRMDDTLRVACLTLMRHANPTLSLVPPLLNDRSSGPGSPPAWTTRTACAGSGAGTTAINDALRAQVIGPVLARLRAFLLRDFVKTHHRQAPARPSTWARPRRRAAAVRLPKGILGEDTARILGSLIVARSGRPPSPAPASPKTNAKTPP